MKKFLFVFLLFTSFTAVAQKKHTINQRNFDELKADSTKAQAGLNRAKAKLARVEKNVNLITDKKIARLQGNSASSIKRDSIYNLVKRRKKGHYKIAEHGVAKWQRRYDKVNSNLQTTIKRDTVVPDKNSFLPLIDEGFYISFNPESALEIQQGTIGMGAGYRLSKRLEIWAEGSYLFKGAGTVADNFNNLTGVKAIVSGKYFYKNKHKFFFGLEFRYKQFTYNDKDNFENKSTVDTLANFAYKLQNTLYGGAVFFGKRFKLSKNGKFEVEALAGTGLKYRFVHYQDVPAGYTKIPYQFERGPIRILPVDYNQTEQWLPYFPAAIRFVYHF